MTSSVAIVVRPACLSFMVSSLTSGVDVDEASAYFEKLSRSWLTLSERVK